LLSDQRQVASIGVAHLMASADGASRRLAVPPPVLIDSTGGQVPHAFHFNNLPDTEEFLELKSWRMLDAGDGRVNSERPWTKIEATLSARVAGVVLQDQEVQLGEARALADPPAACRLTDEGVECAGASGLVVHADFCRPDVGSCPATPPA